MIAKTVKSILFANNTLTALVPTAKIFPYVMNEGTQMPFLVYTIDDVDPEYDKGGWHKDEIEFSVMSFAKNYDVLQPIVLAVRGALEWNRTGSGTQIIQNIYLQGFDEGFILETEAFFNKLTFKVIINKY